MAEGERVLVADDDDALASAVAAHLSGAGYRVDVSGWDGIQACDDGYDLLIAGLDDCARDQQFLEDLRGRNANAAVIVITGSPCLDSAVSTLKGGAYDYLPKPVAPDSLVSSVQQALENRKLFLNIINLSEELKEANKLLASQKDEIEREKNLLDGMLMESNLSSATRKMASHVLNREKLMEEFFSLLHSFSSYDAAALLMTTAGKPFLVIDEKNRLGEEEIQGIKEAVLGSAGISQHLEMLSWGSLEDFGEDSGRNRKFGIAERQIIPIMINDEFLGSIGIFSIKKHKITRDIKNLLRIMATDFAMVAKLFYLYEENKMLSVTDGLTKIFNHRYFQEMLARDFDRARRYQGKLSIILLDVDDFKAINDTYGHQQGDIILMELAQLLKKNTRRSDLVARYGGEEFVVVMSETEADKGFILAESLRKKIEAHCFSGQGSCRQVTVSIGLAEIEDDVKDQFDLIGRADQALYQAKRTGKNRVCPYKELGAASRTK